MSSTDVTMGPQSAVPSISIKTLAEVLVRHHGLHSGFYEALIEFQIGVGAFGPDADQRLPGAMIAVSRIGLAKVQEASKNTVDAAEVNPAEKKPGRKSRAK